MNCRGWATAAGADLIRRRQSGVISLLGLQDAGRRGVLSGTFALLFLDIAAGESSSGPLSDSE